MYWQDEGYLLSKNNFNENSIIIEAFTFEIMENIQVLFMEDRQENRKKFSNR